MLEMEDLQPCHLLELPEEVLLKIVAVLKEDIVGLCHLAQCCKQLYTAACERWLCPFTPSPAGVQASQSDSCFSPRLHCMQARRDCGCTIPTTKHVSTTQFSSIIMSCAWPPRRVLIGGPAHDRSVAGPHATCPSCGGFAVLSTWSAGFCPFDAAVRTCFSNILHLPPQARAAAPRRGCCSCTHTRRRRMCAPSLPQPLHAWQR